MTQIEGEYHKPVIVHQGWKKPRFLEKKLLGFYVFKVF